MNKYVKYWIDSAAYEFEVAESLFENEKRKWLLKKITCYLKYAIADT